MTKNAKSSFPTASTGASAPAGKTTSNKEVITAKDVGKMPAEVIKTATAPAKADKARAIFAECYAMATVPARKDIIQRAVAEAGLTKAGAATYLQNYKTKMGLVVKKAPTA